MFTEHNFHNCIPAVNPSTSTTLVTNAIAFCWIIARRAPVCIHRYPDDVVHTTFPFHSSPFQSIHHVQKQWPPDHCIMTITLARFHHLVILPVNLLSNHSPYDFWEHISRIGIAQSPLPLWQHVNMITVKHETYRTSYVLPIRELVSLVDQRYSCISQHVLPCWQM